LQEKRNNKNHKKLKKMSAKNIVITALSIIAAAGIFFSIWFMLKLRKEKALHANPLDDVQRYIATLPIYASNADALDAGLIAGDRYRKSSTAISFEIVQAAV